MYAQATFSTEVFHSNDFATPTFSKDCKFAGFLELRILFSLVSASILSTPCSEPYNFLPQALYEEVIPAFDVLGKKSFFLGQVGNGAKMKLVVNMIMGR